MAWSSPRTWAAGAVLTAAQLNADVRDNTGELRSGGIAISSQAANDLIIASSSSQLGRVALGAASSFLRVNSGATGYEFATLDRCVAYHNAAQSITADSTFRVLALNAEDVDTNGLHSTVTNNSRVTIQQTGFYLVWWDSGTRSASNTDARLRKGGSTTLQRDGMNLWLGVLTATDYLEIEGYATQATNWGSATRANATSLSVIRLA